jgi:hypothetical protein
MWLFLRWVVAASFVAAFDGMDVVVMEYLS